jgi:pilus assembly protein CpaB
LAAAFSCRQSIFQWGLLNVPSQARSVASGGEAAKAAAPRPAAEQAAGSGIERRRHARIPVDAANPTAWVAGLDADRRESERREADRRDGDRREGDRRQGDRRSTDGLRSNVSWTVSQDRGRGARRGRWRPRLKPSRIVVMSIAVVAGGIAAFLAAQLATPHEQPALAAPAQAIPAPPMAQVLVANRQIGIGQRLSEAALTWQEWPAEGLPADYITVSGSPTAMADVSGAIARSEFLPGDPIRKEKLVQGSDSFLPTLLDGGRRGVSVPITAESASGGFISPNDHVDVVLTRAPTSNDGTIRLSETILRNVRVLAIDSRLGGESDSANLQSDAFTGHAIATLALDPTEAEVIIAAGEVGKLSLLLRSAVDVAADSMHAAQGRNQAIRLSSPFWTK